MLDGQPLRWRGFAVGVIVLDVVVSPRRQRQSLLSLWIGLDWRATPAGHQSRSVPNSLNTIRHSERDGSSPLLFSAWLTSEGIDWESKETPEAVGEGTPCCRAAVLPFDGGNQDGCCHWFDDFCTRAASQPLFLSHSRRSDLLCSAQWLPGEGGGGVGQQPAENSPGPRGACPQCYLWPQGPLPGG